jgi:hypothetical protein
MSDKLEIQNVYVRCQGGEDVPRKGNAGHRIADRLVRS